MDIEKILIDALGDEYKKIEYHKADPHELISKLNTIQSIFSNINFLVDFFDGTTIHSRLGGYRLDEIQHYDREWYRVEFFPYSGLGGSFNVKMHSEDIKACIYEMAKHVGLEIQVKG